MRSKKPTWKIRLVPEKPKEAIRKIEKNGFRLVNRVGGDWFYSRIKDGEERLVLISVHPKELGNPFVKNIIRKAGKSNKEWVSL
mgnify:CR=1 FL=1